MLVASILNKDKNLKGGNNIVSKHAEMRSKMEYWVVLWVVLLVLFVVILVGAKTSVCFYCKIEKFFCKKNFSPDYFSF